MKKIILLAIFFSLFSCGKSFEKQIEESEKEKQTVTLSRIPNVRSAIIYALDSCEYIGAGILDGYTSRWATHRGRCKFCHRRDSVMIRNILKDIQDENKRNRKRE